MKHVKIEMTFDDEHCAQLTVEEFKHVSAAHLEWGTESPYCKLVKTQATPELCNAIMEMLENE